MNNETSDEEYITGRQLLVEIAVFIIWCIFTFEILKFIYGEDTITTLIRTIMVGTASYIGFRFTYSKVKKK